jgi:CO/xanthine dehydrogenase Mo-binding subunit
MRLLHARNDLGNRRRDETKTECDRDGNLIAHEQTHLPVLQLRSHPVRDPASHHAKGKEGAVMNEDAINREIESVDDAYEKMTERFGYDFGLKRRSFMQLLGAGLLIVSHATALAQRSGGRRGGFRGSGAKTIGARIHFGTDGSITVLVGKVEAGQGARAELTQAAAEELRVAPSRIQLIMADTDLVPDDGITAGSGTSPRTVPSVRQGAAAARQLLIALAAKRWNVEASTLQVNEGHIVQQGKDSITYADLAANAEMVKTLAQPAPADVTVTPVEEWKVLGTPVPRPNGEDIVTGAHKYPSDIARPGMLYGKVLRAPSYGAKLISIDLAPAKAMKDVVVVQDEDFVGVAASSTRLAEQALTAIAKTAKWETVEHPSSKELFSYLEKHATVPKNQFADELAKAKHTLRQTYTVAYVQHSPLEPRAAVAEWKDGKLTVWTGSQNPFGCRGELTRAFHLPDEKVRVIIPDFGAAFGGKHSGEVAVEAARLAKAAGKPVSLRWTRAEEFTWAYFRPAAVIKIEAGLDDKDKLSSWYFININSGGSGVETPYAVGQTTSVGSKPPLRHGSYRALAATANNFARECAMDELAAAAGVDPLDFRLAHSDGPHESARRRAVIELVAEKFKWRERVKQKIPNVGIGLAYGTEKGSCVAACAEVHVDPETKKITVRHVCQVFECGAILNPDNLRKQIEGAIVMGLGPALREEMRFENGKMLNTSFAEYRVPRFADLPQLDIHLLNRPDLPSAGAGETPIIAIAPAIGNAVFSATGVRVRKMPMTL